MVDISSFISNLPSLKLSPPDDSNSEGFLLEIAAYDLHLNKLGVEGDEYSLEIAKGRLREVYGEMIEQV